MSRSYVLGEDHQHSNRPHGVARPLHRTEGQLLVRLTYRLALLALALGVLASMPWGYSLGLIRVKHAVLTLLTIVGIGKALLDTFYYDRFQP